MHELSLIADLLRRIDAIAKAESARRVVAVSVWIGALAHISAEHFAEHFNEAAAGTIAAGARLDATVSGDTAHANAQDILLESIEVET
jgi:hydrogenase nickel incorporation protein HypA/HybF